MLAHTLYSQLLCINAHPSDWRMVVCVKACRLEGALATFGIKLAITEPHHDVTPLFQCKETKANRPSLRETPTYAFLVYILLRVSRIYAGGYAYLQPVP